MSDYEIGFEHRAGCPECGSNLAVEQLGVESSPDDRLGCSTCGFDVDRKTFREKHLRTIATDKIGEGVREHVDKAMRDMIKGTGFTLE